MSYSLSSTYHGHGGRDKVPVYLAAGPTTLPQLPTEAWERILDELDGSCWTASESRRRTFAACCLVCWVWLPRSRYHLFKEVEVRSKEQVKQVSKLLHSVPALRTRVEVLHVHGSTDGKKDASWFGLVGFHLGPKLKALKRIRVAKVNFSLTKLESYQPWGAFNRSWQPGAIRELEFLFCTVTQLSQLVRLAFLTKAKGLDVSRPKLESPDNRPRLVPPTTFLPSGISLPLHKFTVNSYSPNLVFSMGWLTLVQRCPSLSSVDISCWGDFLAEDAQLFLVSALNMFCRMQRQNNANNATLKITSFPTIEMRTRVITPSNNTNNDPLVARPRSRRELTLRGASSNLMETVTQVLACFSDAMVTGANGFGQGFHAIEITYPDYYDPRPELFQPLDAVLSRLHITTPDAFVVLREESSSALRGGCILPWTRERLPTFAQLAPNAFCDPESGRPCRSHPRQGSSGQQGMEGGTARIDEGGDIEPEQRESGSDEEEGAGDKGRFKRTLEKFRGAALKLWRRN